MNKQISYKLFNQPIELSFGQNGEIYQACDASLGIFNLVEAPKSFIPYLSDGDKDRTMDLCRLCASQCRTFINIVTTSSGTGSLAIKWLNIPIIKNGKFHHFHGMGYVMK